MGELLIIKNISREGPGLLQPLLEKMDIAYDIKDLDAGDEFPDPRAYKALVVLGGPDSANDATDKMTAEVEQIRTALDAGMPYLGICLGLQTLVKTAGGKVVKSAVKEVGFADPAGEQYTVALTETGKSDPLLAGLPTELQVFHLHGETVELTDTMQLLASGKDCRNQIVKVADKAYGIQSHFELTPAMLDEWATHDPDLQSLGDESLEQRFQAIQANYTHIGETLLTNFLAIAGFKA